MSAVTNVTLVENKNQDPNIIPLAVQMDGKPGGQLMRLDQVRNKDSPIGLDIAHAQHLKKK